MQECRPGGCQNTGGASAGGQVGTDNPGGPSYRAEPSRNVRRRIKENEEQGKDARQKRTATLEKYRKASEAGTASSSQRAAVQRADDREGRLNEKRRMKAGLYEDKVNIPSKPMFKEEKAVGLQGNVPKRGLSYVSKAAPKKAANPTPSASAEPRKRMTDQEKVEMMKKKRQS